MEGLSNACSWIVVNHCNKMSYSNNCDYLSLVRCGVWGPDKVVLRRMSNKKPKFGAFGLD